jgi:glycosyltransferase involved in cell wall biosynthesis
MRILHIANHADNVGNGIINAMVDLACTQQRFGHEAFVASGSTGYEEFLSAQGVEHFLLRQERRPLQLARAAARFRSLVRDVKPQIVHAHMMTGAVLARVLRGNADFGLITTVHNSFQRSSIAMAVGDRVIAVSEAVAQEMIRRGVSRRRLRVVLNGPLGSPRVAATVPRALPALCRPAVITVAGLYERKGIGELIAAFDIVAAAVPAAHLYIVGEGPDGAKFRQQARAAAAGERIHFEGFKPFPEEYMHAADVFVLASRAEPFGLVLAEARAAGMAIVGTKTGGIPEALDGGDAGILVPPRDTVALAAAIGLLLDDPHQLRQWRQRATRNLDRLHVDRMCRETLAVYAELRADTVSG